MKSNALFATFALIAVGCGHKDETVITGADGSHVTVSNGPNGGQFVATGKDGRTVTETNNTAGGVTLEGTDKDGTKVNETIGKDSVSMTDSKGDSVQASAGLVKESDLGLPFYPGSIETTQTGASMITEDPKAKVVIDYRSTPDDPGKVASFYKDKITGGTAQSNSSGTTNMETLSGKLSNGSEAMVMASNDGKGNTVIMITTKTSKP